LTEGVGVLKEVPSVARIVYGVMGDSRGHVARAQAVAAEMPHHDFVFVGGGAVSGLAQEGHRVIPAPVLGTRIGGGRVRILATAVDAVRLVPRLLPTIDRLVHLIDDARPDLIVSDCELFTQIAARRLERPCVSLDNQHLITHCRYEIPPGHRTSRLLTTFLLRVLYGGASRYLVTFFDDVPPKDTTTTQVLPPIIRRAVRRVRATEGDHGLVYLRGGAPRGLLEALGRRKRSFAIYGMGERPPAGNLTFKVVSDTEFIGDLASSRYVLCSGGHSTISEALHFGKPVLCAPVALFYEQAVNAHLLSVGGLGASSEGERDWETVLSQFEGRLSELTARVRSRSFCGNEAVAECLEGLIARGLPRTAP
jgi:uncharacterized protein (TIGR00661 family)